MNNVLYDNLCIICRETVPEGQRAETPCRHVYDVQCLNQWFKHIEKLIPRQSKQCCICKMDFSAIEFCSLRERVIEKIKHITTNVLVGVVSAVTLTGAAAAATVVGAVVGAGVGAVVAAGAGAGAGGAAVGGAAVGAAVGAAMSTGTVSTVTATETACVGALGVICAVGVGAVGAGPSFAVAGADLGVAFGAWAIGKYNQ